MAGAINTTEIPTARMRFAWPWRPYQQRVLDALADHLRDRRLHVVAAPGSGKTILGLEVIRRVGGPAIILSPTRTIRDQWLLRLKDFLPAGAPLPPAWTSRDLDAPAFLTSLTYQALHTRARRGQREASRRSPSAAPTTGELSDVIARFRTLGVGTLVLDEAHHLRRSWWTALHRLAEAIDGLTVVALTATPPYDVTGREWARYEQLCGPIDEEISIPEVVRSRTLCPHQDYVWAVRPLTREMQRVCEYDDLVTRWTDELLRSDELLRAVETHPWLTEPDAHVEELFEDPEFAVSLLLYCRERERKLPPALLRLLGVRTDELPEFSRRFWQVLLQRYLFADSWLPDARRSEQRKAIARRLRKDGLLRNRRLFVEHSDVVTRKLALSPAKLDACVQVHRLEQSLRGDSLRQVVLADFVRDDDLIARDAARPVRLGAWPLLQTLVEASAPGDRTAIALLTGRLVVLHESRVAALADALGIAVATVSVDRPGGMPDGFVRITAPTGGGLVAAFTHLLTAGSIHVLVGTRALLGE
ncbi:MAG TPA: DEAD/DEAH box helicase family protein, partial [Phycisphaerae bacterium]|nr:DEAD/DEAH box helicase family protein [Phycisphaerae bacterium]